MDSGSRDFGESDRWSSVLDAAAVEGIFACNAVLPGNRHGRKSFYGDRILSLFGDSELRGLGWCDSRLAATVGVEGWAGGVGSGRLLCCDAAGCIRVEGVSEDRYAPTNSRACVDTLLY